MPSHNLIYLFLTTSHFIYRYRYSKKLLNRSFYSTPAFSPRFGCALCFTPCAQLLWNPNTVGANRFLILSVLLALTVIFWGTVLSSPLKLLLFICIDPSIHPLAITSSTFNQQFSTKIFFNTSSKFLFIWKFLL
jgi:hypothetical protein